MADAEKIQVGDSQRSYVARALILGLGTTGLEAVMEVRRQLALRWGSPDGLPSVDYLVLETNTQALEPHERGSDEVGAAAWLPPAKRLQLKVDNLDWYRENADRQPYLRWITREAMYGDVTLGAGGVRMKGRVALFHHYEDVYSRVRDALRGVSTARAPEGFALRQNVWVYVVGTLAGGTCSGAFVDIAYLCRRALEEETIPNKTLIGMFTLPNAVLAYHNQAVNAYAALKELNHWNYSGSVFEAQYTAGQLHREKRDDTPPFDYCFLLGPKNATGVPLQPHQQNKMMADFIFQGTATDALDKVHSNLVDTHSALQSEDETGCPQYYMTFGLSTIEFPLLAAQNVLAMHMVRSILRNWISEKGITEIALPVVTKRIFSDLGVGEDETGDLQILRTIKMEEGVNDVLREWRDDTRPRLQHRVAQLCDAEQFGDIARLLRMEFIENVRRVHDGWDMRGNVLEQNRSQLSRPLAAMQGSTLALVHGVSRPGSARPGDTDARSGLVARIEDEIARRYREYGEGELRVCQWVLQESIQYAGTLAERAQAQAESYRGQHENFDAERQEQEAVIQNQAESLLARFMTERRKQIEKAFEQWLQAVDGYLQDSVTYYAYTYAAAVYRKVADDLDQENRKALELINELQTEADNLQNTIDRFQVDPTSLWSPQKELEETYRQFRTEGSEVVVRDAALSKVFAGTDLEEAPSLLRLKGIRRTALIPTMRRAAEQTFTTLKRENAVSRWWRIHHDEQKNVQSTLAEFLARSMPYLEFPMRSIRGFHWQESLLKRSYAMYAGPDGGTQEEQFFRDALMRCQPENYHGGAPRVGEFHKVAEPYQVTAAVTVHSFPLRIVSLVEQLKKHYDEGKRRTDTEEGIDPAVSRADVDFRPVEVPDLLTQQRAWRLLAQGLMLGLVQRGDPSRRGMRFRWTYRNPSGDSNTLASEYFPVSEEITDRARYQEREDELNDKQVQLMEDLKENPHALSLPPKLRGLLVSLCADTEGLDALENAIALKVNEDRYVAWHQMTDFVKQARVQLLDYAPYLHQVLVKWQVEVLHLTPDFARHIGDIRPDGPDEIEVEIGVPYTFRVQAYTADVSRARLPAWEAGLMHWTSDDPRIVSAESRGGCRGVATGTTQVRGEFFGQKPLSVAYTVTVLPAVTEIIPQGSLAASLILNSPTAGRAPIRLQAKDAMVPPTEYSLPAGRLQWRSTKPTVAEVKDGEIVARGAGDGAQIIGEYPRATGEKLSVTYTVKVWPAVDGLVALPQRTLRIALGIPFELTAGGTWQGQAVEIDSSRVKWTMDPSPVGELKGNLFIPKGYGEVVITGELMTGDDRPLITTYLLTVCKETAVEQQPTGAEPAAPVDMDESRPAAATESPAPSRASGPQRASAARLPEEGWTRQQLVELLGEPAQPPQETVDQATLDLREVFVYPLDDHSKLLVRLLNGKVTDVVRR